MKWNSLPLEDSLADFTASLYLCLCWVGWYRVNFYTARMAYPEITKGICNTMLGHGDSHRGGAWGGWGCHTGSTWRGLEQSGRQLFGSAVWCFCILSMSCGSGQGEGVVSWLELCPVWRESVLVWAAIGSLLTFSEGGVLFGRTAMWIRLRCVNITFVGFFFVGSLVVFFTTLKTNIAITHPSLKCNRNTTNICQ